MKAKKICVVEWIKNAFILEFVELCLEYWKFLFINCSVVPFYSLVVDGTADNNGFCVISPSLGHIPPNIYIFSSMVGANAKGSAILTHCLAKTLINCACSIICWIQTKRYESAEAINTMVKDKTPSNQFVISINVPDVIWTWNGVRSASNGWSLSFHNRGV